MPEYPEVLAPARARCARGQGGQATPAAARAGTRTRATMSTRAIDRAFGELLERLLHVGQEPVGVGAVHDPVVERHREHAHGADAEGVRPVGRVMTAGRFSMPPTARIATCGWLMIGTPT